MRKVTCVILIDGFRYDYLNEEDAPFLNSLERKGLGGIVRETFAFQLRPAFFAGLYPEDCDIAHLYWYDPEDSPFKFTRYILDTILSIPFIKSLYRKFLEKYARRLETRKGNTASSLYATTAEIPHRCLKYFGFSEKYITWEEGSLGSHITLFDILRKENLKWLWIAYPTHDQTAEGIVREFKRNVDNDYSLIYLHFAELDWAGHVGGPHSFEARKILRNIDTAIKKIFSILNKKYTKISALIFGDHGMVEIKKLIDIQKELEKTGLKVGRDYVYFLDSTQARFWFYKKEARQVIENMLDHIQGGRILTEKDFAELRFRFSHNRFGELIFVVDDNTLIFPNFFQSKEPAKGMHGYLPHVQGNWAKFIISGTNKKLAKDNYIEMVDIFPLTLDLMNLPVPHTCRGINPLV